MADFVLLSGTSNQPLSAKIAAIVNQQLGAMEVTRFIDNECRVYVKQEVTGRDVFVVESLSQIADQHLVEVCLIGQALKNLKAARSTAVIPWLGYSKQDKEFRKGEAISAQLVAKFIEAAGFDQVITIELHSETVIPFFHIPVTELSTHALLAAAVSAETHKEKTVVVSPDSGGQSRSERFARQVGLPIVYLDKQRDLASGSVTVKSISRPVAGMTVIIFDDIINTGATAIKTSEFLKSHRAGKIFFLATHAVLAGEASRFLAQSPIDQVIVTDTIFIPPEKAFSKLKVVSTDKLLADAIRSPLR